MAPTKERAPSPAHSNRLWRTALSRVTVTVLLALFCAALLISLANDLYAFVKPDRPFLLTVNEPLSLSVLSDRLDTGGVVNNPTVFSLYVRSKDRAEELEQFVGTVKLNASMSYREILLAFSEAEKPDQ